MALALLLLVGSGLMIRSFQALRNVDPGFRDPGQVLLVRLNVLPGEVSDPQGVAETHRQLAERLGRIPGVEDVGASSSATMDGYDSNDPIFVEGFPVPEGQIPPIRRFKWVGGNYFNAMKIPVVAGRAIDWRDSFDLNRVAMITENLAREYWDDPAEAVGKRISTGLIAGSWAEIVGVVGNVRDDGLDQDPTAVVYWPVLQRNLWEDLPGSNERDHGAPLMNYVIRSPRVGSQAFLTQVRDAIWEVNPNLPLASVRTLDDLVSRSMARTSFTLVMLGLASAGGTPPGRDRHLRGHQLRGEPAYPGAGGTPGSGCKLGPSPGAGASAGPGPDRSRSRRRAGRGVRTHAAHEGSPVRRGSRGSAHLRCRGARPDGGGAPGKLAACAPGGFHRPGGGHPVRVAGLHRVGGGDSVRRAGLGGSEQNLEPDPKEGRGRAAPLPQPLGASRARAGMNVGLIRWRVLSSNAYAIRSNAGSLQALPQKLMFTGSPRKEPMGTLMLGYPAMAAGLELPMW